MTFHTVLWNVKSPVNAGMIVRSHVAFGGDALVVVDPVPWAFRKKFQSVSRKLEREARIVQVPDDDAFFAWCAADGCAPVALEIGGASIAGAAFPERVALVVGNEQRGLPATFLARCAAVMTIPQFAPVASLNVAIAASIAIYEINRGRSDVAAVVGAKYTR